MPVSSTPIATHNPPGPYSGAGHAARANLHQLAETLSRAYASVHLRDRLPDISELPRAVFSMDPGSEVTGTITIRHPHRPELMSGRCYLRGSTESMKAVRQAYEAYRDACSDPSNNTAARASGDGRGEHARRDSRASSNLWKAAMEARWNRLFTLPDDQVMHELAATVNFALDARHTELVRPYLLAIFKDYVQTIVALGYKVGMNIFAHKNDIISTALRFIERLSEDSQAEAIEVMGGRGEPIQLFVEGYDAWETSGNAGGQNVKPLAERLIGIVEAMRDDSARARGIGGVAELLGHDMAPTYQTILHAARLLDLAKEAKANPDATKKLCLGLLGLRKQVRAYWQSHYVPTHALYVAFHTAGDENEAVKERVVKTLEGLENFLVGNEYELPHVW